MAADPLPATLSFLTDAAHLLLSGSPETSAHLISQRNSLMFNNGLDLPDVQRQHACGCCGHIMTASQGDLFEMESYPTGRKRKPSVTCKRNTKTVPPRSQCRKTLTCSMCGRYTKIDFPPPARIPKRRSKQTWTSKSTTGTTVAGVSGVADATSRSDNMPSNVAYNASGKISSNASSKKRAKNRKQGLQALLQQSSGSKPQSGLGLSLADFMQQ